MLLGIDVGTTSIKAVLYDPERGRVVAEARHPTPTHFPRPGWSELPSSAPADEPLPRR